MKTIIPILLIIIACTNSFSQGGGELGWGVGEIYIGTRGLDENETVQYKMIVNGSFWGNGPRAYPPGPYTLNIPSAYSDAIAHHVNEITHEIIDTIHNTIFSSFEWPYFRMIKIDDQGTNAFAYGIYKLYIEPYDAYFYIDYRDDNYGSYSNCTGHCQDTWLKYEKSGDKFYYMPGDDDANDSVSVNWIPIENGSLLFHYDIKGQSAPSTDEFPTFWQNCLVLIPSPDNHPRLVWGPYPQEIDIIGYRIYRKYGRSQWDILYEVADSIYVYTDTTVTINQPGGPAGTDVYYYVKGLYMEIPPNPSETESSDTVVVNVVGKEIEKISKDLNNTNEYFSGLDQNFPNPFNPTTTISYELPEAGFVTLKVFDVLGREVATIVNENKPAGIYKVEFSATGGAMALPSGIYFYRIQVYPANSGAGSPSAGLPAGRQGSGQSFVETKKMILMK